jgi:hypothetical protein
MEKLLSVLESEESTPQMVIIANSNNEDRKHIHQYLEAAYPHIQKHSLHCDVFWSKRKFLIMKRCYYCDTKDVFLNSYAKGCLDNNKDESIWGTCKNCNEHISFEFNFDDWDDVLPIRHNNVVFISNYLKGYARPKHATQEQVSKNMFTEVVQRSKVYIIKNPEQLPLGKKKIENHINHLLEPYCYGANYIVC